ncbi:hypothetical protein H6G89_15125 [Oscillatoria sp. FACHB-1407]|uniref:hypothetical protein n=1 Tax=Oscillatoria sp. FACHB-1407 TaxID=2692847 RepID=UPI001686F4A2|nr:hypothetical protein [Oscillatoria sp. FACHB-1407]MBD2462377.1 hypothetical protein [Oscillatoria sp. FACHB-1407]
MKHAGEDALDKLEELLVEIRQLQSLKEKKRGVFYRKSQAFLHFHEDQNQLFADVRTGEDWERFSVNTKAEQIGLLNQIRLHL